MSTLNFELSLLAGELRAGVGPGGRDEGALEGGDQGQGGSPLGTLECRAGNKLDKVQLAVVAHANMELGRLEQELRGEKLHGKLLIGNSIVSKPNK